MKLNTTSGYVWATIAFVALIAGLAAMFFISDTAQNGYNKLAAVFFQKELLLYILIGFSAQLIDGSLGMAYGISSNTFLLSTGVSPAAASAAVHIAEIFTSGASAVSHLSLRNIHKRLFMALLLPGIAGGAAGAFLLSSFNGAYLKPFVSIYLLLMGLAILKKAFAPKTTRTKIKRIGLLAFAGGFLDALGGGGWGPIVNATLLSKGKHPRLIIGTVNSVEFFIAFVSSAVFTTLLGLHNVLIILGLIVGGLLAAPLSALALGKIPPKVLLIIVGLLVSIMSAKTLMETIS